jgi:UDP-N-acetylglucosamine--N-acetylmuramyl-(pentapeptide) pyrophosphoryl-undecaprenol N-acetylglucosamine transferase
MKYQKRCHSLFFRFRAFFVFLHFNIHYRMKKILISGGGTGGHIFPAIAIANRIKKEMPDVDILFIGAQNKMEMKRVPEAGYPIVGLDVYGISRDWSLRGIFRNLKLPFVLWKTMRKAKKTIKNFKPDLAIGVGGFASGPALRSAMSLGVPALIQEQNSFPGVTNKLLAKKVNKICVAYQGLEKYFPKEKIVITGNPIREELLHIAFKSDVAYQAFQLQRDKKTILIVGGSLGAQAINECIVRHIAEFDAHQVQLIWQTGELYYKNHQEQLAALQSSSVKIMPFIRNMNDAYSVADIIVSRAGALAIAELSVVGAPTILVPFPFAAEDHQTKNAQALSSKNAAILIPNHQIEDKLMSQLWKLEQDETLCNTLKKEIKTFARPDAITLIYTEITKILNDGAIN